MRSDKQIEASRRNGAASKGPKTAEGKSISSQNAIKHGLAGATAQILSNEDQQPYLDALERYIARFQPADDTEFELVEMMAAASWRMRRAAGLEIAMFNVEMEKQREEIDAKYEQVGETARQYLAFEAIAADGAKAMLLHRYELKALRIYNTALRNLMRLQADRKTPPPAPGPEKSTEPNEPEKSTQEASAPQQPEPATAPAPASLTLPLTQMRTATLRRRRPENQLAAFAQASRHEVAGHDITESAHSEAMPSLAAHHP